MPSIALCSDNVTQLEHLAGLLSAYGRAHPAPSLEVRRFHSLYDLLDRLAAGRRFSLCLLDHGYQPWMGNLSPEALLRRSFPDGDLVGFTTLPSAAFPRPIPSDPLGLAACICKPVDDYLLFRVLERLIREEAPEEEPLRQPGPPPPVLLFPTPEGPRELPFSSVVHLSYDDHIITCRTAEGEAVRSSTLRRPFPQVVRYLLLHQNFSQVSAAQLVNLDYLREVDRKASPPVLRMEGGLELPIPRTSLPGLLEEIRRYRPDFPSAPKG